MQIPKLYRRRFIPDELVELKDDEILRLDDEVLLTRWKTLKPRKDFSGGVSCTFFDKGWKVSRIMDNQGNCLYTYCDIVEVIKDGNGEFILINDLLVDVIVYEDGFVKVLDMAEIAEALDEHLITVETAKKALRLLDDLLGVIYSGKFGDLLEAFKAEALL
jgi:hypothetical protein